VSGVYGNGGTMNSSEGVVRDDSATFAAAGTAPVAAQRPRKSGATSTDATGRALEQAMLIRAHVASMRIQVQDAHVHVAEARLALHTRPLPKTM